MRSALLVLSLCAGTVAYGQSNTAAPAGSFKLELTPPSITQPKADSQLPNKELWKAFANYGPREWRRRDNAQIDPGMIVRPPKSSIGVQPPGTPIAQNLYPGLRLLPIEEFSAKLEPIPTEWPNLKLQDIPITWPKVEVRLVKGDTVTP
jgi:hypothetical protein